MLLKARPVEAPLVQFVSWGFFCKISYTMPSLLRLLSHSTNDKIYLLSSNEKALHDGVLLVILKGNKRGKVLNFISSELFLLENFFSLNAYITAY